MEWTRCEEQFPQLKDQIIVKLVKCQMDFSHAYLYLRDVEGPIGWFDEWRYANEQEKSEFGKIDCALLNEVKENV